MPFDAGLQLPGHRHAVGGQPAILHRGNFGGQNQLHVAVGIPAGERLIEQARAVLVLGAGGEMRIEQGRSLPPQQFQRAAAAALGRLVDGWALGHGDAADGQNLRGHGRGETEGQHALNEAAAVHAPVLHLVDHGSQFVVQHRRPRVWFWCRCRAPPGGSVGCFTGKMAHQIPRRSTSGCRQSAGWKGPVIFAWAETRCGAHCFGNPAASARQKRAESRSALQKISPDRSGRSQVRSSDMSSGGATLSGSGLT